MKKYKATYGLVTHAERRSGVDFFGITLMANFLLECLKLTNYFGTNSLANADLSGYKSFFTIYLLVFIY